MRNAIITSVYHDSKKPAQIIMQLRRYGQTKSLILDKFVKTYSKIYFGAQITGRKFPLVAPQVLPTTFFLIKTFIAAWNSG